MKLLFLLLFHLSDGPAEQPVRGQRATLALLASLTSAAAAVVQRLGRCVALVAAKSPLDVKDESRLRVLRATLAEDGSALLAAACAAIERAARAAPGGASDLCQTRGHAADLTWLCAQQMAVALSPFLYRCFPVAHEADGACADPVGGGALPLFGCFTNPLLVPFVRAQLEAVAAAQPAGDHSVSKGIVHGTLRTPVQVALVVLDETLRDSEALRLFCGPEGPGAAAGLVSGSTPPDSGLELQSLVQRILSHGPASAAQLGTNGAVVLRNYLARASCQV